MIPPSAPADPGRGRPSQVPPKYRAPGSAKPGKSAPIRPRTGWYTRAAEPVLREPPCARLSLGQQAEALRLHAEGGIELAAEILERDRRGELDDLRLAEFLLQPPEQGVIDLPARIGHPLGV